MSTEKMTNGMSTLTVRGSAKMNRETGDFAFKPYETGEPDHKNVRRHGCCTVYETEGKKDSSVVAHLKVKKETVDPFGEMWPDFLAAMKPYVKQEPKTPRTKTLMEKEGVAVWQVKKERLVRVLMTISLDSEREPSAQLFNLTSEVNKCLVINATSLKRRK